MCCRTRVLAAPWALAACRGCLCTAGGGRHRAAPPRHIPVASRVPQAIWCALQEHAVTLESAVTGVSLNSRDPSKGIVSFALGLPVQVDLRSGAVTPLPAVPGALTTSQRMPVPCYDSCLQPSPCLLILQSL